MATQDDDDSQSDISLTSTIEECTSDQEYNVEDVIAEKVVPYGNENTRCYLIKWTGYDTHDWTWEPKEDQAEGIHDIWDWRKKRIKRGEIEEYNVATWKRARKKHLEARLSRHKKRNTKRERLGLETTEADPEVLEALQSLSCYTGESDMEDDSDEFFDADKGYDVDSEIEPGDGGSEPQKAFPRSTHQVTRPIQDNAKARQGKLDAAPQLKSRLGFGQRGSINKSPNSRTQGSTDNKAGDTSRTQAERLSHAWDEQRRSGGMTDAVTPRDRQDQLVPRPQPLRTTITGYQGTARSKPHSGESIAVGDESAATLKHGTTLPVGKKSAFASKPAPESRVSGSVNVFGGGGGEPRRKRALDFNRPGVEGHHFNKLSTLRMAEKAVRDKEDVAPSGPIRLYRAGTARDVLAVNANATDDSSVATVSDLAQHLPADREPQRIRQPQHSPPVNEGGPVTTPMLLTPRTPASVFSAASRDSDELRRPAKKAKTVRWLSPNPIAQVTTFEYEDDDALFCSPIRGEADSVSDQRTTTNATFGPRQSQYVTCIFESRVTCNQTGTWGHLLSRAQETIAFRHSCEARILISTLPYFRSESSPFLFGVVVGKSNDDKAKLEHVANRLKADASGLLSYNEDLVILVYPNPIQCEWEELETSLNVDRITVVEAVSLKFHAFKLSGGAPPLKLRPGETARLVGLDAGQNNPRPLLVDLFFGLNYGRLLPIKALNEPERQNIIFAYPDSEQSLIRPMMQWLEACNPQCNRFLANLESHWQHFLGLPSGVVIIHPEVVPWLRSFPNIRRLLRTRDSEFRFWVLPGVPVPTRLLMDPEECIRDTPGPSRLPIKEIFAGGYIFLLTPSFLLSQPREAYLFLKWFQGLWSHNRSMWGLAVADDFDTFMLQANTSVLKEPDHREGTGSTQHRRNLWSLIQGLAERSLSNHRPFPNTVTRTPLTYASHLINAGDEQSLVNWFGAWSLTNAHRFRRFYVLGSSTESTPGGRTIKLPLPCYMVGTVNDPDALCPKAARQRQDMPSQNMPSGFNGPSSLCEILNEQCQRSKLGFLFIYNKVVGYVDNNMATLHKDPTSHRLHTFESWFRMYDPNHYLRKKANTFVGFFLTPPEQVDDSGYHPTKSPGRFGDYTDWHPWVAMYRPFLGRKIHGEMELLLWDPRVVEKYGQECPSTIAYDELLYSQRKLIDMIKALTPSRATHARVVKSELKHVWLGGFGLSAPLSKRKAPPENAIDRCISFIEEILCDTGFYAPLAGDTLRERGYSLIGKQRENLIRPRSLGLDTGTTGPAGPDKSDIKDGIDMTGGQPAGIGKLHIIYHAPHSRHGLMASKCRNLLFDQTREARSRGATSHMDFTYPPTMKWWEQQEMEGRDFQHITVVPGSVQTLMDDILKLQNNI